MGIKGIKCSLSTCRLHSAKGVMKNQEAPEKKFFIMSVVVWLVAGTIYTLSIIFDRHSNQYYVLHMEMCLLGEMPDLGSSVLSIVPVVMILMLISNILMDLQLIRLLRKTVFDDYNSINEKLQEAIKIPIRATMLSSTLLISFFAGIAVTRWINMDKESLL